MKRIRIAVFLCTFMLLLSACSIDSNQAQNDSPEISVPSEQNNGASSIDVSSPIIYEEINVDPNLVGNLISGSYIIEHNGLYYFRTIKNNFVLYSMDMNMENDEKLTDDFSMLYTSPYMQVAGEKIFSMKLEKETDERTKSSKESICVYDLETGKESTISDTNVFSYTILDGWVYYTTGPGRLGYGISREVYKMRPDGSELTLLATGITDTKSGGYIQIVDGRIYLLRGQVIVSMDLNGSDIQYHEIYNLTSTIYEEELYYAVDDYGDEEYGFYKTSISDIGAATTKLSDWELITYTIIDDTIYFATLDDSDEGEGQKIFRMDLDGNNLEYLVDGKTPIVLGDYLFFSDNNFDLSRIKIPE